VREFFVFVPCGQDHLAATITVPDEEPRGLVVLSTGLGANRSHRFQMWTRLAERLSQMGLASARWEYPGLHDSSGEIRDMMLDAPRGPIHAVARFAQQATGVDRVLAAGNCLGGRLGLFLAADMPGCIGAVCIIPPVVEPGRVKRLLRRVVPRALVSLIRRQRWLGRRVFARLARLDAEAEAGVLGPLPRALARSRVLFVFGEEHIEARADSLRRLRSVTERLSAAERERFELVFLHGSGLDRFSSAPAQRETLDLVSGWIDRRFAEEESRAGRSEAGSARR